MSDVTRDRLVGARPVRARARRTHRDLPLVGALSDAFLRRRVAAAAGALTRVRPLPPPYPNDIIAVIVARDEALRLPDVFRHHRALGVDRFILIDNRSRDATREVAMAEPDVEVLAADGSYARARHGLLWMMAAIRMYGLDRWYLCIDADELFVYDGCESDDLHRLAERLDRWRIPAMPALTVDMYGENPVRETVHRPDARLVDTAPLFDDDYEMDRAASGRWIVYSGGPRARLLNRAGHAFRPVLAKTPFLRWNRQTLYRSSHEATPAWCNIAALRGCLLRFQLMHDFPDRVLAAAINGEHRDNALEYRLLLDLVEDEPALALAHPGSRRYTNSHDLVTAGLMPAVSGRA